MKIEQGPDRGYQARERGITVLDLARRTQRVSEFLDSLNDFPRRLREIVEGGGWKEFSLQRLGETLPNENGEIEPAYDHVRYEDNEFELFVGTPHPMA